MPLLTLDNASFHYGQKFLLDQASLTLERGEKIGVLGRNGEGKTTLLKVIAGDIHLDSGERWQRPGIRISTLPQELPEADDKLVYDVVASGLAEAGELIARYHALARQQNPDLAALERVQHRLEAVDGWNLQQRVDTILTKLQLDGEARMAALSGGWRRRVALARALVSAPDILLLDEPTNHLDIPSIEWLETMIGEFRGALMVITHDRAFLTRVTNKIIELDRGALFAWEGGYTSFLKYREERLAAEDKANDLFDKRLAEEEKWIRQGIKARRTRNEGRVRQLKAMREERMARRDLQGSASFSIESAERSGKIVADLKDVGHSYGANVIIDSLTTTIIRGDKVGIVGTNGAGKSTLLKILLGELDPDRGSVKLGTKLEVAYFDQLRQKLDPEKNLLDNICEGRESITINGKERHGISYLGDFLFTPDRIRTPVKALSGGEQNRAILAKLFSKPANVLVLDEPTNDLDLETLELLEEILANFEGTVFLVSHDRAFMDNVVTSILVFEGEGKVTESVGGYGDWVARGGSLSPVNPRAGKRQIALKAVNSDCENNAEKIIQTSKKLRKLSYKDQRELDALPEKIEALELEMGRLQEEISSPDFYQEAQSVIDNKMKQLAALQEELDHCFDRWTALEE